MYDLSYICLPDGLSKTHWLPPVVFPTQHCRKGHGKVTCRSFYHDTCTRACSHRNNLRFSNVAFSFLSCNDVSVFFKVFFVLKLLCGFLPRLFFYIGFLLCREWFL